MSSERDDDTIERARREIRAQAERLRELSSLPRNPPDGGLSRESAPRGNSRAVAIGELTDRHHLAFVEHAFHVLLGRAPERAEADAQLARLSRGASKAELLGDLRWSSEGRAASVRVTGLSVRYLAAKARRIPVLGYLLDLALAFGALPLQARHQRAVESWIAASEDSTRRAMNDLAAHTGSVEAHLRALADATATRHSEVGRSMASLQGYADAIAQRLGKAEAALQHHDGLVESCRLRLDELEELRRRLHGFKRWAEALEEAISRIEAVDEERRSKAGSLASRVVDAAMAANGVRESQLREWLALIADGAPGDANALVLASGRDWKDLISTRGWTVVGDAGQRDDTFRSPQATLARIETGSIYLFTTLALPVLATSVPFAELLPEISRVLRHDGRVLFAFGREPDVLLAAVAGRPIVDLDVEIVEAALTISGFRCRRIVTAAGSAVLTGSRAV